MSIHIKHRIRVLLRRDGIFGRVSQIVASLAIALQLSTSWISIPFWLLAVCNILDLARIFFCIEAPISDSDDVSVVIAGAGISGICAAIKLREAGVRNVVILEKLDRLGGTWLTNTYPGVACDILAHLYSFSFSPNPSWSSHRPPGAEILKYVRGVAEKFRVTPLIRFGHQVRRATWDESTTMWTIDTTNGKNFQARFFIPATGALFVPNMTNIKGRDKFQGPMIHTAEWDDQSRLRGKRVAVIGTGAASVQVVPTIAPDAEETVVFQRSPPWVPMRKNPEYSKVTKAILAVCPWLMTLYRSYIFLTHEFLFYAAVRVGGPLNNIVRKAITKDMAKALEQDEDLIEKLIPKYDPFCKRVTPSLDYLKAFRRSNVKLVTTKIREFTKTGLKTKDGKDHSFDVVILATGYDVLGALKAYDIVGKSGKVHTELWGDTPQMYLGITNPDFPNAFSILGANSALGHNSLIFVIECQVSYIVDCMRKLQARPRSMAMRVKPRVMEDFNLWAVEAMKTLVFGRGCRTWYSNERGVNFTLYPGTMRKFWWSTRECDPSDFEFGVK